LIRVRVEGFQVVLADEISPSEMPTKKTRLKRREALEQSAIKVLMDVVWSRLVQWDWFRCTTQN
jgi:hypothetical protein